METVSKNETPVAPHIIADRCGVSRATIHRWRQKGYLPVALNETEVATLVAYRNKKGDIHLFKQHLDSVAKNETGVSKNKTPDVAPVAESETPILKELREQVKNRDTQIATLVSKNETLEVRVDKLNEEVKNEKDKVAKEKDKVASTLASYIQEQQKNTQLLTQGREAQQRRTSNETKVIVATMLVMIIVFSVLAVIELAV